MADDKRRVSRRGLFDVFGRGFRELKGGLRSTAHEMNPRQRDAATSPSSPPSPSDARAFDRILCAPEDLGHAVPASAGVWDVDLRGRTLGIGECVTVSGGRMPENVVLVRVHEHHFAACTGECGVDGSDVLWDDQADRLRCPSCRSEWRLDGEPQSGPADYPLGRIVVDAYVGDDGSTELRISAP